MTFHPVFNEFLSTLVAKRVRFLVVGAHALALHGKPRYTDDLDIWIEPTLANAKRVVSALSAFGYEGYRLHESEFSTPDRMTHLGEPPLRIDLMTSITGVEFGTAWASRVQARIAGLPLSFLGRAALEHNKAATGRAKDVADLALLAELPTGRSRGTSRNKKSKRTKRPKPAARRRTQR